MLLKPVPESIRSSYDEKGRTMYPGQKPVPYDRLTDLRRRNTGKATPGTILAMLAADDAVRAAGGDGLRVTESYRSWSSQERERVKYDAWVSAGRPSPGKPGWRTGMRRVYVTRPGESQHGWGGANDWHVYVMGFDGIKAGTNESLSVLWDIVRPLGWRPVIREPRIGMSEAWHFDHFGPLEPVRAMFYAHRGDGGAYRNAYGNTAAAGHALAGTWQGDRHQERYLQALLLLGGEWIGRVDGRPGKMTAAGYTRLTSKTWPGPRGIVEAINEVQALQHVSDALAAL